MTGHEKLEVRERVKGLLGKRQRRDVTELVPAIAEAAGNVKLYIQELSTADRHAWIVEDELGRKGRVLPPDSNARLVIASLVFDDGTPVLDESCKGTLLQASAFTSMLAEIAYTLNKIGWREGDAKREEASLKNGHTPSQSSEQPQGGG